MPAYSLPDMWDIADEGKTLTETEHDEDGLAYLLEVTPRDGLVGTSFSGLYVEQADDPSTYTVAMVEGSTDGFLVGGRAQGRVIEYETKTDDPATLAAELQEAYLQDITAETTALLESMLDTDAGIDRDPLTSFETDHFIATCREDLERVYDEAF